MQVLIDSLEQITRDLGAVPLHPVRVLIAGRNGVPAMDGVLSRVIGQSDPNWREREHTVLINPDLLSGDPDDLLASLWHAIPRLADTQAEDEHFSEDLEDLGRALPSLEGEDEDDPDYLMRVREHFARAMTGTECPLDGEHESGWPVTGWSDELIHRMDVALRLSADD